MNQATNKDITARINVPLTAEHYRLVKVITAIEGKKMYEVLSDLLELALNDSKFDKYWEMVKRK